LPFSKKKEKQKDPSISLRKDPSLRTEKYLFYKAKGHKTDCFKLRRKDQASSTTASSASSMEDAK